MEELGPELKAELAPRLKGKPQERQRQWIQVGGPGPGRGGGVPAATGRPPSPQPGADTAALPADLRCCVPHGVRAGQGAL